MSDLDIQTFRYVIAELRTRGEVGLADKLNAATDAAVEWGRELQGELQDAVQLARCHEVLADRNSGYYEKAAADRDQYKKLAEELAEALTSIQLRCKEGDPNSGWLPIIERLARETLAKFREREGERDG